MQPGETRELSLRDHAARARLPNGSAADPHRRRTAASSTTSRSRPSSASPATACCKDRAKRRKYGLPPDLRPPKLEDDAGRARNDFRARQRLGHRRHHRHHRRRPDPDRARATRSATRPPDGRRTVALPAPTRRSYHFFSIQSARYAVKRAATGKRRRPGRLLPPRPRLQRRPHARRRMKASLDYSATSSRPTSSARPASWSSRPTPTSPSRSPTPSRTRENIGFITELRATPTRSTSSPTSPRTRSATSGGRHQVDRRATSRARPCSSRRFAQYSALMVMEQHVRPGADPQVPEVRARPLPARAAAAKSSRSCRSPASRTSRTSTTARARW